MAEEPERFTKDRLLLMIDAAIGQLATVRTVLSSVIPDDPDDETVQQPRRKDKHAGHQIVSGGFGAPDFCLTCDEDVGVSTEEPDSVQP